MTEVDFHNLDPEETTMGITVAEYMRLVKDNERLREACRLSNEAFNVLCLHPTNEVPDDFFAAWSRTAENGGIGYRAHSAVFGIVMDEIGESEK